MRTKRNWARLCLSGALLLLPVLLQAQFTFITSNDSIIITAYTGSNSVVVIPGATNGYTVSSVGRPGDQDRWLIVERHAATNQPSSDK